MLEARVSAGSHKRSLYSIRAGSPTGWKSTAFRQRYYNPDVGRPGFVAALSLLLLVAPTAVRPSQNGPSNVSSAIQTKQHGVAFEHAWGRRAASRGYGTLASGDSLSELKNLGVNWVSLTPFGFQRTPADTEIRWGGSRVGETDDRIRAVATQARDRSIRVMLKPHVWLRPPAWVGMVAPETEEDWAAWFGSYRDFILHYAALARDTGIDALCIGNELKGTTHREREWRDLISEIRGVYGGVLTYGAHADEVWTLPFWDALDYIGVSAYFTLADKPSPTRSEMVAAWKPHLVRLERLSTRWDRPVLFTELGYRSVDFAAQYPWKYDGTTPVNLRLQADAYRAFFEAVWPQPWFAGVHWWKWLSSLDDGGAHDDDYTPRAKPAEEILRQFYSTPETGDRSATISTR